MSWFPTLSFTHFCAFLIYTSLIITILSMNSRQALNRVAAGIFACFAIWSLGKIFMHNPGTPENLAILFDKIDGIAWCTYPTLALWFTLIITGTQKPLKSKLFYALIVILPALSIYAQWANLLMTPPSLRPYGWHADWKENSIWPYIYYVYYGGIIAFNIAWTGIAALKTSSKRAARQLMITSVSTLLPMLIGTYFEVIVLRLKLPGWDTPATDIINLYVLMWAIGTYFAIFKYQLFQVTPAMASDNIIANMTDSLVLLDGENKISFVNEAAEKLLGYSKSELLNKPCSFLFADDIAGVDLMNKIIKGQNEKNHGIVLKKKDGWAVPAVFSAAPIMDEGSIKGTVCVLTDLTERRQAEDKLRESEKRFTVVFEKSTAGISLTSPEGKVLKANDAFAKMLGYTLLELQGKNFADVTLPEDNAETRENIRALVAGEKKTARFEKRYIHKNGGIVWADISTSLMYDDKNEPLYLMTTIIDITERKKAQSMVAESEEKLRSTFEQAQVGVVLVSGEKKFILANRKFCEITGYSAEELYGMSFPELTHKDDLERDIAGIKELASGKNEIYTTEKRYIRKDKSEVWANTTVSVVKKDGKFHNFVAVIDDISVRKKAEEALLKSEGKLRRFYESGLVGVVYWNMDGKISDGNDRFLEMVGYTRGELENGQMDWSRMTPGEFAEVDAAAVKELLETGVNKSAYEKGYYRKDGTMMPVIIACAMLDEARRDGVAFVLDITDRKNAEESLVREKEKIERFLKVTEAIVVELDAAGNIASLNEKACGIFDIEREKAAGINWFDICVPEEAKAGVKKVFAELMAGRMENTELYENEIVIKDGLRKSFYWHNTIIRDKNNRITGTLSSGIDITELRKAEKELKKSMENLERSNQELERFAFIASHDLQEPLRAVIGYTQLLEKKYAGRFDAEADHYIKEIVEGSGRMRELIKDLLAFSRIDSMEKEVKAVDVNSVLETVIFGLGRSISESAAVITKDPLPAVIADETHVLQLLQNLIGNAIKFRSTDKPMIHVSAGMQGNETVLSVRDNGIGIEPKYFEKIFVIFQRLHARDEYPGTGIGLAICRKIVERYGCRIWVDSEPGKGSVFYFTLPKA